jgi:hypothetical protein
MTKEKIITILNTASSMTVIKRILVFLHLISLLSFVLSAKVEESDDSCFNNSLCENTTISDILDDNDPDNLHIGELVKNIFKFKESTKYAVTTTESSVNNEASFEHDIEFFKSQNISEDKFKNKFCNCDLFVSFSF